MISQDNMGMLYYLLAAVSLVLGIWWGHVITLRSWWSWWGDVSPFLSQTVRRIVREELQRERSQADDRGAES